MMGQKKKFGRRGRGGGWGAGYRNTFGVCTYKCIDILGPSCRYLSMFWAGLVVLNDCSYKD